MSWRSHGTSTNDSLIYALEKNNLIASRDTVGKAMRKVDRKCYVESADAESAYRDHPLQIGSNATISAPHMHAMCLELSKEYLVVNDDDASGGYGNGRVLDVGSGSGYLVACFAEMMIQQNGSSSKASGSSKLCQPFAGGWTPSVGPCVVQQTPTASRTRPPCITEDPSGFD